MKINMTEKSAEIAILLRAFRRECLFFSVHLDEERNMHFEVTRVYTLRT
jgi:hypothetical protein